MRRILLAVGLATTISIAVPIVALAAPDIETQQAQAGPTDEHESERLGGGPGRWMQGQAGPMMGGWRGRMMHRMANRNPQERCEERLAWRAAMRAYTEAKLDLTPEQRPLWDKVESAAQAEEAKERQLCAALKGPAATFVERMNRMEQFLSARLDGLRAAQPAIAALYEALTPAQRAIIDNPFRRS